MGYKATIKTKKLHGPAAYRHRVSKACKAIEQEIKTKELNKNPKLKNNGKWMK